MLTKKIVKYIQSLSHKKFRDEEGVFIAEGPKVVAEFLLSKKFAPEIICAENDWLAENEKLFSEMSSEDVYPIDRDWLLRISHLKTPNKVLVVFRQTPLKELPVLKGRISLVLDDLQDPGNMGTIIRIADWFNIENIICSENSVDCYNPKVVQSTMGSLCRVNIYYTDLLNFISNQEEKIAVYSAALDGKSVFNMETITEGLLLIGNESKGIHPDLLSLSTHKITIPRFGHAESLNAAVATGIIISHFMR